MPIDENRLHNRAPLAAASLALIAAIAVFGPACNRADLSDGRQPNLVLIVIDSLRRDHLGIYGYPLDTSPTLDALAKRGLLFENAIAQSSWTLPSVASLFTSRLPAEVNPSRIDEAPLLSMGEGFATLAGQLSAAGYRTVSVSANPYFIPSFGLTRGFAKSEFIHGAQAQILIDRAVEMLDSPSDGSDAAPFFLYLHFMDVHTPNNPPPPYDTMFPTIDGEPHVLAHWTFAFDDGEALDTREFEIYRSHKLALYDGCIRFVDDQIARLVDHLAQRGWLDSTALWIGSDHGEEMWEHAALEKRLGLDFVGTYGVGHGQSLVPELIEVPLIASGAGIPIGRLAGLVRNLDVATTLLGQADEEPRSKAAHFAGVDLLARFRDGNDEALPAWSDVHKKAHRLISLRRGPEQLLRIGTADHLFTQRPNEPDTESLTDVSDTRPGRLSELSAEVDGILEDLVPPSGTQVRLNEEFREKLRDLGYLR